MLPCLGLLFPLQIKDPLYLLYSALYRILAYNLNTARLINLQRYIFYINLVDPFSLISAEEDPTNRFTGPSSVTNISFSASQYAKFSAFRHKVTFTDSPAGTITRAKPASCLPGLSTLE